MNKIITIVCLIGLTGCATPTIREQKFKCVERFLSQNVDALKAKEVCQWGFEYK